MLISPITGLYAYCLRKEVRYRGVELITSIISLTTTFALTIIFKKPGKISTLLSFIVCTIIYTLLYKN